jgi:hypothetical protein
MLRAEQWLGTKSMNIFFFFKFFFSSPGLLVPSRRPLVVPLLQRQALVLEIRREKLRALRLPTDPKQFFKNELY